MQHINYYAKLKYLTISLESLALCLKNDEQIDMLHQITSNKFKNHLMITIQVLYHLYYSTNHRELNSIIIAILHNQELLNQYIDKFCNIYYKTLKHYTLNIFDAKYLAYLNLYTIYQITTKSNILFYIYYLVI